MSDKNEEFYQFNSCINKRDPAFFYQKQKESRDTVSDRCLRIYLNAFFSTFC